MTVRGLDCIPLLSRQVVGAVLALLCAATVRCLYRLCNGTGWVSLPIATVGLVISLGLTFRIVRAATGLVRQARLALTHVVATDLLGVGVSPRQYREVPLAAIEALLAFGTQPVRVAWVGYELGCWLLDTALRALLRQDGYGLTWPSDAHARLARSTRTPILESTVTVEAIQRFLLATSSTTFHSAIVPPYCGTLLNSCAFVNVA